MKLLLMHTEKEEHTVDSTEFELLQTFFLQTNIKAKTSGAPSFFPSSEPSLQTSAVPSSIESLEQNI